MSTDNQEIYNETQPEEIHNMPCDTSKPYAFISYSHQDTDVVHTIFTDLYHQGLNLWIDGANLPHDQNSWTTAAGKALMNKNCKCAFFFRSETSTISPSILQELIDLSDLRKTITSVDIWQTESQTRYDDYRKELLGKEVNASTDDEREKANKNRYIYKQIREIIHTDCNAIQGTTNQILDEMTRIYKKYVSKDLLSHNNSIATNVPSTVSPTVQSNISTPLKGAYCVKDLVPKYNNKTFTAKLYTTVGQEIYNEIKPEGIHNMPCDTSKPYAFISYSHQDADVVHTIFTDLYHQGLNLWIDGANLLPDQESWGSAATRALIDKNCKCAFFFRSEASTISEPILRELSDLSNLRKTIVSVDIWKTPSQTRYADYRKELLGKVANALTDGENEIARKNLDIYTQISAIMHTDCNAIQGTTDQILHEMTLIYKEIVSEDLLSHNHSIATNVPSTVSPAVQPNISTPLKGAYCVKDLVQKYNNKTFTAKLYTTVGMRITNHPEYTIEPCKNLCQVLQSFAGACIQQSGESYIQMVNAKNPFTKNPVFVPSSETGNYKVHYGSLPFLPSWSMNVNFNPYGYLKNLEARLTELGISPADAELIFDEKWNIP